MLEGESDNKPTYSFKVAFMASYLHSLNKNSKTIGLESKYYIIVSKLMFDIK